MLRIILIVAILLVGCSPGDRWQTHRFIGLNTTCSIRVYESERVDFEKIENLVKEFESKVSFHSDNSQISRINELAGKDFFYPDKEVFNLIKDSKRFFQISDGSFDPTIGPLSSLWGIGSKNYLPNEEEIKAAKTLVNFNSVLIDDAKGIMLQERGMEIDLGGIAKGYLSDQIRDYLVKTGVTSAIINLGGNITLIGSKADDAPWKIGIQDPNKPRGSELGVLELVDTNIISSGGYERNFTENGRVYHHILDPVTGYPKEGEIISSTIVSSSGVEGDGLSTIFFGLSKDEFIKLQREHYTKGVFLFNDDTIYISKELVDMFTLKDARYRLITELSLL